MTGTSNTAENILTIALVGKKLLSQRRSRMDKIFTAIAILLFGVGIFLSILGLARFLETLYRPDIAAIFTALIVFITAFFIILLKHLRNTCEKENLERAGNDIEKNLRKLVEAFYEELNEPIRDNPKMALLISALAGFLLMQNRR